MNDLATRTSVPAGADHEAPPAVARRTAPRRAFPAPRPDLEAPDLLGAQGPLAHPALFLEPRAWTAQAARTLRARGVPVVVLAASRLSPACAVRGVQRQHLPPLGAHPERWQARLLELAARLEPRPALYACTPEAAMLLQRTRRTLEPHYVLASLGGFGDPAERVDPDVALREALSRSEAALEVQLVMEPGGRCTGAVVLAWAAGAPPDVLVTSVGGTEVRARSQDWLASRGSTGYARLVWSPDRFGRLTLQAASRLPGLGLALAALDGVDFAYLAHAAAFGVAVGSQEPACRLVRRLAVGDAGGSAAPWVSASVPFRWNDPIPALVAFLHGLART